MGVDFAKFLYPEVMSFMCNMVKTGFACHLVTFGRGSVQECKFKLSGLDPYFDEKFYVEQGSKANVIKNYLDSGVSCEKAVFVDDTIEHLELFRNALPGVGVVRIARPGAKGSDIVDTRFETIQKLDVQALIMKALF